MWHFWLKKKKVTENTLKNFDSKIVHLFYTKCMYCYKISKKPNIANRTVLLSTLPAPWILEVKIFRIFLISWDQFLFSLYHTVNSHADSKLPVQEIGNYVDMVWISAERFSLPTSIPFCTFLAGSVHYCPHLLNPPQSCFLTFLRNTCPVL